ncbi:Mov34/MPN/PAD-1 family protein [candidate division WOR-3 bacterium]|nr:Mov34/MPN/PAD-1 family protein [candidate division WOR-3 bacterium]
MAENNEKKTNEKEKSPTPIEAYLELPAFLVMVSSSVEVYHKETMGYLLGIKGENKFSVRYAIPFQTVERGLTHATIDMDRVGRINEILRELSAGLELIGDFHSHTQFGDSPATVIPSNADLMSSMPGKLNIICAVNQKRRKSKWQESARKNIIGSVGDYHIEIGGYYVAEAGFNEKYQRVIIKCSAITGLEEK